MKSQAKAPRQPQTQPSTHTIRFSVDENGFTYRDQGGNDAKKKHVKPKDLIEWKSDKNKDFAILFKDDTPFVTLGKVLSGEGGATSPKEVTQKPGITCSYTLALPSGLSDDPEIIIDL